MIMLNVNGWTNNLNHPNIKSMTRKVSRHLGFYHLRFTHDRGIRYDDFR
jgi:hypothetical protein